MKRALNRHFRNRTEAGQLLAARLLDYGGRSDVIVLALPRGGVPVGYEVAKALSAPLDVFIVRKLGVPGHEELAMGAVAGGGVRVINDAVVSGMGIPQEIIEEVTARERAEVVRRERAYRDDRPAPDVRGRIVILVDDGLATGSTLRAAVTALRHSQPARLVIAVPTAPRSACQEFAQLADEFVCLTTPEPFYAIGLSYEDFSQVEDDEVKQLLESAGEFELAAPASRERKV
jgi:predicted phosphoribosyltransferase